MKQFGAHDLLICDEWIYVPIDSNGSKLLFTVVSECFVTVTKANGVSLPTSQDAAPQEPASAGNTADTPNFQPVGDDEDLPF
ncbi:hypothetical protein FACS1894219_06830 [Clostridia bacterium]|nr:hypothetical protein FACS1894219_06830 [Clostridia bacterium]